MALQGRVRESRIFGDSAKAARQAESDAEWQLRKTMSGTREAKETTEKQAYTWFKDLYTFANANKDNLDDPDVQDIIDQKMQKIESAGFFTRSPKRMTSTDAGGGLIQAPESEQASFLRDFNALQQRFMMEEPANYKPQTQDVYTPTEGYVTKQFDPIMGDKVLGSKVSQVAEGSGLFTVGPRGEKQTLMQRGKTATPEAKGSNQVLAYNKQDPSQTVWVKKGEQPPEGYTLNEPKEYKETGKLTESQKLDILNDVEKQINKAKADNVEITQDMVDWWNRQLKGAGLPQTVSREEIVTKRKFWFDKKETQVKVVEGTGKSLDEIFGRK